MSRPKSISRDSTSSRLSDRRAQENRRLSTASPLPSTGRSLGTSPPTWWRRSSISSRTRLVSVSTSRSGASSTRRRAWYGKRPRVRRRRRRGSNTVMRSLRATPGSSTRRSKICSVSTSTSSPRRWSCPRVSSLGSSPRTLKRVRRCSDDCSRWSDSARWDHELGSEPAIAHQRAPPSSSNSAPATW